MLINVEALAERLRLADDFYARVVNALLKGGTLDRTMRLLVVCGGPLDRDVLQKLGFSNVTISNVDTRTRGEELAPFDWSYQDAEHLTYADGEFDFTIAHNGLHHCFSPHRALCEMHRVSRVGFLAFEPHDNALSRLTVRFGFGQDYESAAVFDNGMQFGGVANSEIPNHVYRWTEDEVRKLVKSYSPYGPHRTDFFYGIRIPWAPLARRRSKAGFFVTLAMLPLIKLGHRLFPRVCNNFAFCVVKPQLPDELLPWLKWECGTARLDRDWMKRRCASANGQSGQSIPS